MSTQGPGGQRKTLGAVVVIVAIVVAVGIWYWDRGADMESDADTETVVVEETVVAAEAPAAADETQQAQADESDKDPRRSETPPTEEEMVESTGYEFSPEQPYKLYPSGKVNFAVRRGSNLYHNICHVCHGLAGMGSAFAPSLVESLKYISYEDFVQTVMNGRENLQSGQTKVMPSFGENKTVVKYIDSLYGYLKARSDGAIPPGDPEWEGPKTE